MGMARVWHVYRYSELNKMLRRGNTIALDKALEAGAAGSIELKAKNDFKLNQLRTAGLTQILRALMPTGISRKPLAASSQPLPHARTAGSASRLTPGICRRAKSSEQLTWWLCSEREGLGGRSFQLKIR